MCFAFAPVAWRLVYALFEGYVLGRPMSRTSDMDLFILFAGSPISWSPSLWLTSSASWHGRLAAVAAVKIRAVTASTRVEGASIHLPVGSSREGLSQQVAELGRTTDAGEVHVRPHATRMLESEGSGPSERFDGRSGVAVSGRRVWPPRNRSAANAKHLFGTPRR